MAVGAAGRGTGCCSRGDGFGSTKTCSDRDLGVKGCWGRSRRAEIAPCSPPQMQHEAGEEKGCLEKKPPPGLPQVLLPNSVAESAWLPPRCATAFPAPLHVPASV